MKRDHLYVVRKHPLVWLSVLSMLASAASAIVLRCDHWPLHTAAIVWYVLIVLLSGDEMLYRTAVPVWILGISFVLESNTMLTWIECLPFCFCYTAIISGQIKKGWLLPCGLVVLVCAIFFGDLPEILAATGLLLLYPAIGIHNDGKYHPDWGDRIDGRRVRTAQVMEQITAYFMPNRTGASNLFSESVEITELERYIRRKRREGLAGFGMTHVILAAYVRTVAKYPALNRFIAGQHIYSRGEDIAACMTVKKELTASAPDSLIKVHLHPADSAADVYRKFQGKVEEAKKEMETTADSTVFAFMMVPGLILKAAVWLLKCMDYFGLVPKFLLEISPFHGSIYFTNVGSLGIKPVFHHLYDFGTVPVFCAFGRKRRAEELKNGEIIERKYLDITFNLDERICDGFYYAGAIKYFLRLLSHPDALDNPPDTINNDIL